MNSPHGASPLAENHLKSNTHFDRAPCIALQQNGTAESQLGHKRTLRLVEGMSALLPKADIRRGDRHVRFVPKADIQHIG
jgi:hypothetical protein